MVSVTKRISSVKQPRGGYLPVKSFEKIELQDDKSLFEEENIDASLVGMAVDYLTRFVSGADIREAFNSSLRGALNLDLFTRNGHTNRETATDLLGSISQSLDDKSIINACKLTGFDVVYRSGLANYRPIQDISPDNKTLSNIKIMIERGVDFLEGYGPITANGFSFDGAYTDWITAGDGDYLTTDTLWDFKVSRSMRPTSKNTLQLLIYYIMGRETDNPAFQSITNLGIFNPRHNVIHRIKTSSISEETLNVVSSEIIGY